MKNFGTFVATNGDIPDNAPEELTRPTDQLFNNLAKEPLNLIKKSGQTPTTLTNDDLTQVSKAVNIHALTAQTWDCSNSGNNYSLTRFLGDYDANTQLYAGARFLFNASAENTGDVNINITSGSLNVTKQLLLNGQPLIGGELEAGKWYEVIYYAESLTLLTPVAAVDIKYYGVPIPYPSAIPPAGHVVMQGQTIDPVKYPILAELYGANLPDLRGEFIRGWDNGRGIDIDRELLSYQLDALEAHEHVVRFGDGYYNAKDVNCPTGTYSSRIVNATYQTFGILTGRSANETRSRNIAFNYICIAG